MKKLTLKFKLDRAGLDYICIRDCTELELCSEKLAEYFEIPLKYNRYPENIWICLSLRKLASCYHVKFNSDSNYATIENEYEEYILEETSEYVKTQFPDGFYVRVEY